MGRGRPRGFGEEPGVTFNRFEKFYYKHRERLNKERRAKYAECKAKGLCIRCRQEKEDRRVLCARCREREKARCKQL